MPGGRAGNGNDNDDKGTRNAVHDHDHDHEGITTTSSGSDTDLVKVNLAAERSPSAEASTSASAPASTMSTSPQLVYAKSKVYIHPSSYSRDNVPGWITIVKRGKRDFLLSWIPEGLLRDEDKERYIRVEIEEATGSLHMTDESLDAVATVAASSGAASYKTHTWSVPLTAIYSVIVHPPTLANWYGSMQVHISEAYLQANHSDVGQLRNLPGLPLFFHDDESPSTMLMMDRRSAALKSPSSSTTPSTKLPSSWGGEDLILALKRYSNVVKSTIQPSLYLINPSQTDLEAHSVPLYEDELLATGGANALLQHRTRSSTSGSSDPSARTSVLHQSLSPHATTANAEALPTLDNLTFNVLSSFSRLTHRARSTAHNIAHPILSHPLSKPILKHLPPPIASLANANSPEYSKWAENAGVAGYDAARVYLARWARTVAEEGERARRAEMKFEGGGLAEDVEADELVGGPFEVLATTYRIPRPRSTRVQGVQPIIESEWKAWFDPATGKLMLSGEEAKRRIFQRGLVEGARREAWPFLLDVYPWDSTASERADIYMSKKDEYEQLKGRWFGRKDVTSTEKFVEEHHRIQIDCLRTDRNQTMFSSNASAPISGDRNLTELYNAQMAASTINTAVRGDYAGGQAPGNYHTHKLVEILLTYDYYEEELGYVQGQSDLCAPLYVVLEGDETLVFWCFTHLMESRMKPNFYRDQTGMKNQLTQLQELIILMDPQLYRHLEKTDSLNLFFCFRWILIAFKREFAFEDVLSVWENLWSAPSAHFHLFVALSILELNRTVIIRYLSEFDEVLKYINELAGTLEPQPILSQAEVLYLGFKSLVEATDKRKAEREAAGSTAGRLRQRKTAGSTAADLAKAKDDDPLVKLVNDEVDAEARVPDIAISDELRSLLK